MAPPDPPDRELLEAFVPEFEAGLAHLAAAPDAIAAGRVLEGLRSMAASLGLTDFAPGFEAASAALEVFDTGTLAAAAASLGARLRVLGGAEEAQVPAAAAAQVRVLVVDDSPTMRRIMRDVLAEDPVFEVVGEAADGEQALARIRDLSPDLVLLDIEMPVLDGLGVLRRWTLAGSGAVVVVSSAAPPGSELARELRRLGAAGVVDKPSGALSFDLATRRGAALLAAAHRAVGRPTATPTG
jgi:two-component system, chemotaxis family, protein-glutamate methylesterase/glutaminase